VDTRRSKSERETKDYLEKNSRERENQGGVKELGSSRRDGTESVMTLLCLLARRDMMMIPLLLLNNIFALKKRIGF